MHLKILFKKKRPKLEYAELRVTRRNSYSIVIIKVIMITELFFKVIDEITITCNKKNE
jgi:hypothetical protein